MDEARGDHYKKNEALKSPFTLTLAIRVVQPGQAG